jgi:hypothetical protein
MWEPRRLTTLWASMACYRNNFNFILNVMNYLIYRNPDMRIIRFSFKFLSHHLSQAVKFRTTEAALYSRYLQASDKTVESSAERNTTERGGSDSTNPYEHNFCLSFSLRNSRHYQHNTNTGRVKQINAYIIPQYSVISGKIIYKQNNLCGL